MEFEPGATTLEREGVGYVVASLGVDSGYVPYTAYSAKQSFIEENPELIQGFTNALQKGMDYVQNHTPEEIAQVIAPQFEETDLEDITTIVTRYYEQDTWKENLIFEEDSFTLLQDILDEAGELEQRVPYEDLVTVEFAQKSGRPIKSETGAENRRTVFGARFIRVSIPFESCIHRRPSSYPSDRPAYEALCLSHQSAAPMGVSGCP